MSDVCYKCRGTFPPGSMVSEYENRSYHPHCLTCKLCRRSVSGQKFFKDENNNLICKDCSSKDSDRFSSKQKVDRCKKCYGEIQGGEAYKKLEDGTVYHSTCFTCYGPCKLPLGSEFYELDAGKHICENCYAKYGARRSYDDVGQSARPVNEAVRGTRPPEPRYESTTRNTYSRYENPDDGGVRELSSNFTSKLTTYDSRDDPSKGSYRPSNRDDDYHSQPSKNEKLTCEKCGKEIKNETYSVYNDKTYHSKCFKCSRCKKEFKDLKFFKIDGEPVCASCNEKEVLSNASKCRKCKKPILEGTVLKFMNEEYHEHCLTCKSCNGLLRGTDIYTSKNDPYCISCYTRKEAKKCEKCKTPIPPNEDNVVFEDKPYHKDCFTCDSCKRKIYSNESFTKRNNAIICKYCARN